MTRPEFPPVDEQMELLERGAVDLVDRDLLRAKLERSRTEGKPLVVKTGFDPSTPDLHLGHAVLLGKMRHFQQLGHTVIFLIGDFTGMIGDPSGRKATRPQLSREEVMVNSETYKRQVFHVLDPETTVIDYNNRWLGELTSEQMVRLAGKYTLARMMEREDFRERFRTNQPISIHELLYPLVQAYDSVALEADVELGGHDQIFNLLVGRTLMKEYGLEPQVVLTVPLLVGTDGVEKMSKSLGNAVALEDPPREMYGKTMSIPDELMWDWWLLLGDRSAQQVEELKSRVESGDLHPKAVKQELARFLVTRFHDADSAAAAELEFERVFSAHGVPEEVPEISLDGPHGLTQVLAAAALAKSKNEARRLIQQNAVSIDGETATDPFMTLEARPEPYLFKVGKRRFARVHLG